MGVAGGIQPDRLASVLMRDRDDDGMLARFCPVFPEPVPVTIPDRTADPIVAVRAFERLYGLVRCGAIPTDVRSPRRSIFDEAARLRMLDYYARVRADEGRDAGLLNSFVGKTPGMIARIALILSLLDWAAGRRSRAPGRARHGRLRAGRTIRHGLPVANGAACLCRGGDAGG